MPDKTIGRYLVIKEIGRGGMGVVLEVYDPMLNRKVALKLLSNKEEFSREREYFLREAKNTARLRHPNIVTVYDIGEQEEQVFFTMDLIRGSSFHHLLEQNRVSWKQGVEILEKIARAVHYAHKQGIIHRDIKPSNIMINEEGEPKLMDFGLAKEVRGGTQISQSGIVVGTPAYMPPEQIEGKVEFRSDVYALGAVLYQILTGKPPFESETSVKLMITVLERDPVPPRKFRPDIPRELEAICLKALAKKPTYRYQTAEEMADDLRRYLRGEMPRARHVSSFKRLIRWALHNKLQSGLFLSLGFSLILLACLISFFLLPHTPKKVLLLFSYEADLLWDIQIKKAIQETFQAHLLKEGRDIVLWEHYMETKKFSKPAQIQEKVKQAIKIIQEWKPDLVITMDDDASGKVIPHFFKTSIQFIFCGLNNDPSVYHFPQSNVTGIRERLLVSETFDNLHYFLPDAQKYVLAIEDSVSGNIALREIEKDICRHTRYQRLATLISEKFSEWTTFLKKYEPDIDFVLIPVYLNLKDDQGNHVKPDQVMQWILKNISKPPIGALSFNVEHGALFGIVDTATKQGQMAAFYATQILKGQKKTSELKITSIERGDLYINKTTAKRYNIVLPSWVYQFATILEN